MARIQGYSEDDVDLLILDFEKVVESALTRTAQTVANNLQPAIVADASAAALGPQDVATVTAVWQEEIDGTLTPYIAEVYQGSAAQVAIGLGESFVDADLPGIPLVADEFTLTYMKTVTNRLTGVGDELWEDIRNELLDGIAAGQGIPQIRDRIVAVSQFSQERATTIARTEIHGAAESGSITQMRFVGYGSDEVEKEWIAVIGDGRTRHDHILANGQKVGIDEKFVVGGYELDHPGVAGGPANEVINCRCTQVFNVHEKPKFRCAGALMAASPPDATTCIVPVKQADISGLDPSLISKLFNAFMSYKITPAYGGAKIHKILKELREASYVGDFGFAQPIPEEFTDFQILAAVDKIYVAKKDTFSEKYTAWYQSPAGKKVVGISHPSPRAVKTGIDPSTSTSPTSPVTPPVPTTSVLSPPSSSKFTVLEDPGPSGDGYAPGGQWGKYGAAGAIIRAKDAAGVERFLLIQRNGDFDAYEAWKWQLPGGALDGYEDAYQGAAREIMEELLVPKDVVESLKPVGESVFVGPGGWEYKTIATEINDMFHVAVDGKELSAAQWFTAEEIETMVTNGDVVRNLDHQIMPIIKSYGQATIDAKKYEASFDTGKFSDISDVDGVSRDLVRKSWKTLNVTSSDSPEKIYDSLFTLQQNLKSDSTTPSKVKKLSLLQLLRIVDENSVSASKLEPKLLNFLDSQAGKIYADKKGGYPKSFTITKLEAPKPVGPSSTSATFVTPIPPRPSRPPIPPVASVTSLAPSTPGVGAAGDISSIPYVTKKLISDAWKVAGGGKKVTPGWGGAKIFKVLQDLKEDAEVKKLGLSDLQIIRILDEQGGFIGKPKTYESEVVGWLKSPGSTKVLLKMGLPDTSSLKPGIILSAVPTPIPVTPIVAPVLGDAENALANGVVVNAEHIFQNLDKYKAGDVIAYGVNDVGDVFKITKKNAHVVSLWGKTPGGNVWTYASDQVQSAGLDLYMGATDWSLPVGVKGPSTVATKIAGLAPNDAVTPAQIWGSKNLWDAGDVIAMVDLNPDDDIIWQLYSDGKGGILARYRMSHQTEWTPSSFTMTDEASFASKANAAAGHTQWKLTGDVLSSVKKESNIPGKNVGDVLSNDDIWMGSSTGAVPLDTPFAYAYDVTTQTAFRLKYNGSSGSMHLEKRPLGATTWSGVDSIFSPKDLEYYITNKGTFHAAQKNGKMPDEVRALIPGGSTKSAPLPGPKPSGVIPGKNVGEHVTKYEVWDAQYNSSVIKPGDVIAHGTSVSGTKWRIVYQTDDTIHSEFMAAGGSHWVDKGTLHGTDLMPTGVKWFVSDEHVAPTPIKPAKVAKTKIVPPKAPSPPPAPTPPVVKLVKRQTHIPSKHVGDVVTKKEVMAHFNQYEDGQIIATMSTHSWGKTAAYRVVKVNDKLVQQKQTVSGAWGGTKVINSERDLEFGVWKADNAYITPVHLKAAKKKIAPHTTPTPKVTSKTSTPTLIPTMPTGTPLTLTLRAVDLSPWNDTEQQEIFDYFRGLGTYATSAPEKVWSSLQQTKSHFQTKYKGKYLDLNEIEILRIADAYGAKKGGVADAHILETKLVNWLKSPAGKSYVNKTIDAPLATHEIPPPKMTISESGVSPDAQTYPVISTSEAIKYRSESHTKYGGWKTGEKEALRTYTGGSYSSWNNSIRQGDISSYRDKILKAQAGMRPSTRAMLLHRGTGFTELNDPSIVSYETLLPYVGRTYVNRGFNSTSVGGNPAFGGQLLIEYEAPIGTPMAYLDDFSMHHGEREMLLPTHLIYEIRSVTKKGSTTVMRVRVIGVATP